MRDDRAAEAQNAAEAARNGRSRFPERLLIVLIVLAVAYAFAV